MFASTASTRPAGEALSLIRGMALQSTGPQQFPLIGPAVRLLLHHYDLEGAELKASGPKKNVLKSDVLSHISTKKLKPTPVKATKLSFQNEVVPKGSLVQKLASAARQQQKHVDIPLSNMRQTIARRLSQSKSSIPHAYASTSISANVIALLRKELMQKANLKLSLNDFIIKACAQALRAVPEVNVQWGGGAQHQIVRMYAVDVSVAVATPAGLITPILCGADRMSLAQISAQLREMAGRAREGKLRPEEFQGGSFTISNLGMFGSVTSFTAIINPPQAAILAVGGIEHICELPADSEGPLPISQFGVTLCYDARAIDEQTARRFLDQIRSTLSTPESLLAGVGNDRGADEEDALAIQGLEGDAQNDEEQLVKLLLR